MELTVLSGPAPAISVEDAKRHLRVESSDDDDLIAGYIAAVQGYIDGPDGWLGRAIGMQTIELTAPRMAYDVAPADTWIALPCRPVVEITSIAFGSLDPIDASLYVLGPGAVVRPVQGSRWPWSVMDDLSAVRVRYKAGSADTPPAIRAALLLMTADLYEFRGAKLPANLVENPTIERLLSPLRVFS